MDQKKILVVDDEETFLLSIKRVLDGPEYSLTTAESFEEAMNLLDEHDFHIVISDIRLTNVMRKEGLEILQHIKRNNPRTMVVILTGYGSPEIMEEVYSLGANLYMEKPVSLRILQSIIENRRCSLWNGLE